MNVNVYDQNAKFIATVNGGAVFVGCNCVGNSVNRVLQIDLDILKLDVSALEGRLPSAISQNESNIDSVRLKQKDMEFIIWQQQQTICKLNERTNYLNLS